MLSPAQSSGYIKSWTQELEILRGEAEPSPLLGAWLMPSTGPVLESGSVLLLH